MQWNPGPLCSSSIHCWVVGIKIMSIFKEAQEMKVKDTYRIAGWWKQRLGVLLLDLLNMLD